MNLEEYRVAKGLSYRKLGALINYSHASRVRLWCLGENYPDADVLEKIFEATDGEVTVEAMYRQRLMYVKRVKYGRDYIVI
jgi:transcriptional regulator with XRE-family HTH domain